MTDYRERIARALLAQANAEHGEPLDWDTDLFDSNRARWLRKADAVLAVPRHEPNDVHTQTESDTMKKQRNDIQTNDIAKIQGKVYRFAGDKQSVSLKVGEGKFYWVDVNDLELVERPVPSILDLPDGTFLQFHTKTWEISGNRIYYRSESMLLTNADTLGDYIVVGAKIGTPAWELWAEKHLFMENIPCDLCDGSCEWWKKDND
jgi:hypothetical protein